MNDVVYQPGELKIVAYKNGKQWATESVKTTGAATKLNLQADRTEIKADGSDLSFITLSINDNDGLLVPKSKNLIRFSIEGPAEICATDSGEATDLTDFHSSQRKAFNGLCLAIVKATKPGLITIRAESDGLKTATTKISAN